MNIKKFLREYNYNMFWIKKNLENNYLIIG